MPAEMGLCRAFCEQGRRLQAFVDPILCVGDLKPKRSGYAFGTVEIDKLETSLIRIGYFFCNFILEAGILI